MRHGSDIVNHVRRVLLDKAAPPAVVEEVCEIAENNPLFSLCSIGEVEAAREMLEVGANPNIPFDGITAAHAAVQSGSEELVSMLLRHGTLTDATDDSKRSLLCHACAWGQFEIAAMLVKRGASVTNRDVDGYLPAHVAVERGHVQCLALMLHSGTPIDSVTAAGRTLLYMACDEAFTDAVRILLSQDANPLIKGPDGHYPAHVAAGQGNVEILAMLLDAGTPLDAKSDDGLTLLVRACHSGTFECVHLLLERGADPTTRCSFGATAAHMAIDAKQFNFVPALLEAGTPVNATSEGEITLLHAACERGDAGTVTLLLKSGADDSIVDSNGWLPAHKAAARGFTDGLRLLLTAGTPIDATNNDGHSILNIAAQGGCKETVRFLIQKGANATVSTSGLTAMHLAVMAAGGSTVVMAMLADSGVPVDEPNDSGTTPLWLACLHGELEATRWLLQAGANHLLECKTQNWVAAHAAIGSGSVECLAATLDAGTPVGSPSSGESLLSLACRTGRLQAVELLLERGATPLSTADSSFPPALVAISHGHVECLRALLDSRLPLEDERCSLTLLQAACIFDCAEAVRMLVRDGTNVMCGGRTGDLPIMLAANAGLTGCVTALLDADSR